MVLPERRMGGLHYRRAALSGTKAFEAIGSQDAFQLKCFGLTMRIADVRYNVIQWVHRSNEEDGAIGSILRSKNW